MEGVVKKKRIGGMLSLVDSSLDRYFRFWLDGRVLCYYDLKPV